MGCDGGSIPKRCEMVREQPKKELKDRNMDRKARWFNCAVTQQRLTQPIVSCRKGRLYNKEPVIEHILGITPNKLIPHIKKSKDIKTLNLTKNPSYNTISSTSNENDGLKRVIDTQSIAPYICPVTATEMNGHCRFGFIWSCGCVLSEKAIKEVVSDVCHKCGKPYNKKDFVLINSEETLPYSSSKAVGKKSLTKSIPNAKLSLSSTTNNDSIKDENTKKGSTVYRSLFTSSEEYQTSKKTNNNRVMFSYL